jgi:flavodoxin
VWKENLFDECAIEKLKEKNSQTNALRAHLSRSLARFRKAQELRDSRTAEGSCLKILVVYDTVSVNRNTEKVAETLCGVLKEKGFDVDCLHVNDVDPAGVKNYDCVLAGSPTQWRKATEPIMQFLDRFAKDEFSRKLAAAFDTQLPFPLSGNAANGIEKKLKKLGFKTVTASLVTHVESKKTVEGKNEIRMREGELEKAKKYAEDLANKLHR